MQQMVVLYMIERKYIPLSYSNIHLLLLKALCEDIISHLYKHVKGWKTNSHAVEENISCIYTDKSKNISPGTKHIAIHINFFKNHIYEKYSNLHGDIILEYIDT